MTIKLNNMNTFGSWFKEAWNDIFETTREIQINWILDDIKDIRQSSLVAQTVKNLPAVQETWVQSLGWEDPLEKGMIIHSSILAWRIPMNRGAWQAIVHEVTKSQTWLSDWQHNTIGENSVSVIVDFSVCVFKKQIGSAVLSKVPGLRCNQVPSTHEDLYSCWPSSFSKINYIL